MSVFCGDYDDNPEWWSRLLLSARWKTAREIDAQIKLLEESEKGDRTCC